MHAPFAPNAREIVRERERKTKASTTNSFCVFRSRDSRQPQVAKERAAKGENASIQRGRQSDRNRLKTSIAEPKLFKAANVLNKDARTVNSQGQVQRAEFLGPRRRSSSYFSSSFFFVFCFAARSFHCAKSGSVERSLGSRRRAYARPRERPCNFLGAEWG